MKESKLISRFPHFNYYILFILLLIGFSILYFLYHRTKNQEEMYISVSLSNSGNTNGELSNLIAEAIKIGDKDISSLGGVNAEVVDKEEYEANSSNKYVYLVLKARAVKDKSGAYLFKNKPLLVGGMVNLRLGKTLEDGQVNYMGIDFPKIKRERLRITIRGTQAPVWFADGIKVGSTIVNSKEEIEAKIIDKKIFPATSTSMRYDSGSNKFILYNDPDRKDYEVTLDIVTTKTGDYDYYARNQRIKISEWIYFPFKEVGFGGTIISVASGN